jgi:hypothetical protein
MLRHPKHSCLCIFHARAESQLFETERLGVELGETLSGDFMSATDINHSMGRLYVAVAQDRLPFRNANTLARIASALLRSVKDVKTGFTFKYRFEQRKTMLQNAPPHSSPDDQERSGESTGVAEPAAPPSDESDEEAVLCEGSK